jgi:DNA-binding beta-propeller fold protein YncE
MLPHSVWVDNHNRVWVADRENYRIQIFDTQGKYLAQWANLAMPCNVFIDKNEVVYVPELMGQRLSIFTINGKLLARWYNIEEKEIVPFIAPHSVAVDSHGDIYVTNSSWILWGIDQGSSSVVKIARKT